MTLIRRSTHCRSHRPRPDARRRLGPGRHHRHRVPDDVHDPAQLGDRLPGQVDRDRRLHPRRGHRHRALLADPGARRRRLRALHGLRADHHRLDHDRRDLTGRCRDRRVPRHPPPSQ
ncbi:MAG: hypothetical protein MZU91_12815 [Desulfosudis oleivorans]|nr:hypothetical protein [Desulfosudis oleivorans]